ncbi:hypothetical protein [Helicobacter sp. MIT 14-3879]|uniref:hypothetical protein n=1 Tax=Helicobacter sp. MIT 14-3879 TaxID=2040649 RepID=UPI000E1F9ED1|nr:hypothetical protein [Helicobacter sp. MIT 14-3879]RDU61856.1 hypothetical protein CQA44_07975 [Helicobacter sp. MIT 14-3879]
MDKVKQTLINFVNKIQSSKDKKLYILAIIAIILLIGFIILIFIPDDAKPQNELIDDSNTKINKYELDSNVTTPSINNNVTTINNNAIFPQTNYEIDVKPIEKQSNIQVLPQQNNNMVNTQSIDEISNNIENNRDIKTYLKSIQTYIIINQDSFTYNNKTFRVGEKFEGYLIEAITPIYIRFVDDKSALHYNLRFIEEK